MSIQDRNPAMDRTGHKPVYAQLFTATLNYQKRCVAAMLAQTWDRFYALKRDPEYKTLSLERRHLADEVQHNLAILRAQAKIIVEQLDQLKATPTYVPEIEAAKKKHRAAGRLQAKRIAEAIKNDPLRA